VSWGRREEPKIRSSIEQTLWGTDMIDCIRRNGRVLYHRPSDGDPMPEAVPLDVDDIVSELFKLNRRHDTIRAPVLSVFDIVSAWTRRRLALSVPELTQVALRYYSTMLSLESDGVQPEVPESFDDRERGRIGGILARLKSGRMRYYQNKGIYDAHECRSILSVVDDYLEDLYRKRVKRLDEYMQRAFPADPSRWRIVIERQRISNILALARKYAEIEKKIRKS
jgi:hypothetical protein